MSDIGAEKSIQMLGELLKEVKNGKYKYFIGDVCEANTLYSFQNKVNIKFPYYYDIDNEPSYVVNETPMSFKESELKLIAKNKGGCLTTIRFLQDLIEKYEIQLKMEKESPARELGIGR